MITSWERAGWKMWGQPPVEAWMLGKHEQDENRKRYLIWPVQWWGVGPIQISFLGPVEEFWHEEKWKSTRRIQAGDGGVGGHNWIMFPLQRAVFIIVIYRFVFTIRRKVGKISGYNRSDSTNDSPQAKSSPLPAFVWPQDKNSFYTFKFEENPKKSNIL